MFLTKCRNDYSAELIKNFDDIRNYYAQSMMLIVIGYRGGEDSIPWVYDKYTEFQKYNFDGGERIEGALAAIYKLYERFYA